MESIFEQTFTSFETFSFSEYSILVEKVKMVTNCIRLQKEGITGSIIVDPFSASHPKRSQIHPFAIEEKSIEFLEKWKAKLPFLLTARNISLKKNEKKWMALF